MKHDLRLAEAILFAASEPIEEAALAERFAEDTDIGALIDELVAVYAGRGVNLVRIAGGWCFRTAEDLAGHMRLERKVTPQALARRGGDPCRHRLPPAGDAEPGRGDPRGSRRAAAPSTSCSRPAGSARSEGAAPRAVR